MIIMYGKMINMESYVNKIESISNSCPYRNKEIPICNEWLNRKECDKKLCCGRCPENASCDIICDVIINKLNE